MLNVSAMSETCNGSDGNVRYGISKKETFVNLNPSRYISIALTELLYLIENVVCL